MSLIRYQFPQLRHPFSRLALFQDEIDRLFGLSQPSRESALSSGWSPALDVYDDKDKFVVQVELPGLKKEAINLSVHQGVLTISGERKDERKDELSSSARSERSFGKFQRSVTLPAAVDAARVSASYKDGVLVIDLPKAEEAKPKQIDVSVS